MWQERETVLCYFNVSLTPFTPHQHLIWSLLSALETSNIQEKHSYKVFAEKLIDSCGSVDWDVDGVLTEYSDQDADWMLIDMMIRYHSRCQ